MSSLTLTSLKPSERLKLFQYLTTRYSRLTVKILLGYEPDGVDRLTIMLGKGSDYDYKLINEPEFRESELKKYINELLITTLKVID